MTKDYAIKMMDFQGRTTILSINGASIDELVSDGYSHSEAVESVESNALQNALSKDLIGEHCWVDEWIR